MRVGGVGDKDDRQIVVTLVMGVSKYNIVAYSNKYHITITEIDKIFWYAFLSAQKQRYPSSSELK